MPALTCLLKWFLCIIVQYASQWESAEVVVDASCYVVRLTLSSGSDTHTQLQEMLSTTELTLTHTVAFTFLQISCSGSKSVTGHLKEMVQLF